MAVKIQRNPKKVLQIAYAKALAGQSLQFSRTFPNGKVVKPDEFFIRASVDIYREYKNYDGVVSLSKFNKAQLEKYAELTERFGGKAEYVIKNGQASGPFKQYVAKLNTELNAKYGVNKVWVELLDDAGKAIV